MEREEKLVERICRHRDFRLNRSTTDTMNSAMDTLFDQQKDPRTMSEKDRELMRAAYDYTSMHDSRDHGDMIYLEEFDRDMKLWKAIAFGTGGKPAAEQYREIVGQLLDRSIIYSCSNGFRNWSQIPVASSLEELDLKLSVLGI